MTRESAEMWNTTTMGEALEDVCNESLLQGPGSSMNRLRAFKRALDTARRLTLEDELAAIGVGLKSRANRGALSGGPASASGTSLDAAQPLDTPSM
jgi:hypothetical protein